MALSVENSQSCTTSTAPSANRAAGSNHSAASAREVEADSYGPARLGRSLFEKSLFERSAFERVAIAERSSPIAGGVPYIHVVVAKETLYSICRRYEVSEAQLQAANPGLTKNLRVDQEIEIPGRSHTVLRGETVYRIAKHYEISEDALRRTNSIVGNQIGVGDRLFIPGAGKAASARTSVAPKKPPATVKQDPPPLDVRITTTRPVSRNETSATVEGGLLVHADVTEKTFSNLEHGSLSDVKAIVLHQTDSSSASSTLSAYKTSKYGAHFLIDKQGKIYQTAHLDKKAWHVGPIRSRCMEEKLCDESSKEHEIMNSGAGSWKSRKDDLVAHELTKSYPDRYPTNSETLGIELVGKYDGTNGTWEKVNDKQNAALEWLMGELQGHYDLTDDDVFFHNEVSRKKAGEAESADWH